MIDFGEINEANIEQLKVLNTSIFPVRYNPKFYNDILYLPEDLNKYAYYNGLMVGAICCRLEPIAAPNTAVTALTTTKTEADLNKYSLEKDKVYIMTLGVFAAYRKLGIGSSLLNSIMKTISTEKKYENIKEIYLHVQTNNVEAIDFYTKKHDFEIKEKIENYYKRISPPDCFVLSKKIERKDIEAEAGAGRKDD